MKNHEELNTCGIVIGRDLLDMIEDAGKRHVTLRNGIVRATITMAGGDISGKPCLDAGVNFDLAHFGVYEDGQNFARYANIKSPQDMVVALRGGFTDPTEYKWKRRTRAKAAAEWVAEFLPYAACIVIGFAIGFLFA
jgi:hypothetical protein